MVNIATRKPDSFVGLVDDPWVKGIGILGRMLR